MVERGNLFLSRKSPRSYPRNTWSNHYQKRAMRAEEILQIKEATPGHPVLDVIKKRWSPRAFADRRVEPETLEQLLEAARWAASSFNEQPWRFILATKDEPEHYARVLDCLIEGNQAWAQHAPVLMLTVARKTFTRNGKPNRHAWHDVGLAMGNMVAQATALGLHVHQMAGILPEKARVVFAIPDDYGGRRGRGPRLFRQPGSVIRQAATVGAEAPLAQAARRPRLRRDVGRGGVVRRVVGQK